MGGEGEVLVRYGGLDAAHGGACFLVLALYTACIAAQILDEESIAHQLV